MAVDKDTVRLAYQLLLGREPESEDVVDDVCNAFDNISDLRNHFMLCEEFQYTQRFMRFAEQAYNDDQDVRAKTLEFETFLSLGGQTEAGISHLIQSVIEDPKASPGLTIKCAVRAVARTGPRDECASARFGLDLRSMPKAT